MANTSLMHYHKRVQNLFRNFFDDCFLRFPVFIDVLRQIAVLDVLHSKIGGVRVLEPTKKLDEKGRVLPLVSLNNENEPPVMNPHLAIESMPLLPGH